MGINSSDKIQRDPVDRLSDLVVDVDKDWLGFLLKNLGVPIAAGDALRRPAHVDDVTFRDIDEKLDWSLSVGEITGSWWGGYFSMITRSSYADKAVEKYCLGDYDHLILRCVKGAGVLDGVNMSIAFAVVDDAYFSYMNDTEAASDFQIRKVIAGTVTSLASEAVDLVGTTMYWTLFSVLGSTLKGFRADKVTAKLSVSDTSLTLGSAGVYRFFRPLYLRAAASPSPKPVGFFEVPIVGDGSSGNPFRAGMPEEIVTDAVLGKRNLLSVSHSSLIPCDLATGKPVHGSALVRVFEQPDRSAGLRGLPTCLGAIRGLAGVRKLTRGEAVARARVMDSKLHMCDLVPQPLTPRLLKEYTAWREALGVKRELIDDGLMERHIQEDKGW